MKKYLAVFVAPVEAYDKMKENMKNQSSEEQKKEMDKWTEWMERNKSAIIDPGAPVGAAKRVSEGGDISDIRNTIGGYMVIQAESHEDAADVFKNSPHFGVVGGGVEVMEITEMPS